MNDVMKFSKTFDEFIKQYSFFDKQQIYTNGSELIHVFRIKQWEEHKEKENQELKKQLKEWKHHLKCSKEMLDIQGQKGNYDYDDYMLGLYNGMEYIIALFETREPNFISGKNVRFTNNKSQQKEFIKYLEDEKDRLARECSNIYEDSLGHIRLVNEDIFDEVNDILQKYKSIIGVSDEKEN